MALLMVGWSALLRHNLSRGERVIAENPGLANYLVLSADFLEYRDYFARFPTRLADLNGSNIDIEFYKRPLYGPISGLLSVAVHRFTGITYPASMQIILSFYASLAVVLLVGIAKRLGLRWIDAALLGAVGMLSFSWLSVFSVPESYSLSVCAALLAMHSGLSLTRRSDAHVTVPLLAHSVMAGLAAWVYLPLCGAALMVFDGCKGRRQWFTVVVPCAVIAVTVAFAPHAIRGADAVQLQLDYGAKWTAATNLNNAGLVANVFTGFFWFALVAPVHDFIAAPPSVELLSAWRSWGVVPGVALLTLGYVFLMRALRDTGFRGARGVAVWLLALLLFHVFFNPVEVLLHVSVPLAATLFIVATGIAALDAARTARPRLVRVALLVAVAVLAIVNLPAALGMQ